LVWTQNPISGDGSGFISDNGLNDFFVPRVNADVINTGLFSYFGTANYDFDSRFGVTGTIRRDASLDFLKQIDGVHFGPLQVLEYCR
jgi:hypothetical protein